MAQSLLAMMPHTSEGRGDGVFRKSVMVSPSNETDPSTDRDLERYVTAGLLNRHVPALRQVGVRAERGTITLRGIVTSFYQKQLCIQACHAVPGVVGFVDEVEVSPIIHTLRDWK